MTPKRFGHALLILIFALCPRAFGSPAQEVSDAFADLLKQQNYSWTRQLDDRSRGSTPHHIAPPPGSAQTTSVNETTHGRTDNGEGISSWELHHEAQNMSSEPLIADVQGVTLGRRSVVSYGAGWLTLQDLVAEQVRWARENRQKNPNGGLVELNPEEGQRSLNRAVALLAVQKGPLMPGAFIEAMREGLTNFSATEFRFGRTSRMKLRNECWSW